MVFNLNAKNYERSAMPFGDKPEKGVAAPVAAADACASKDSDADGVNDCDDKCAGTAAGTKVDEQGCPIVMELKGVNFHFDSAELTDGAKHILKASLNSSSHSQLLKT